MVSFLSESYAAWIVYRLRESGLFTSGVGYVTILAPALLAVIAGVLWSNDFKF